MSRDGGCDVRCADSQTWDDVQRLFGRAGASNGCWCQYWLSSHARRPPEPEARPPLSRSVYESTDSEPCPRSERSHILCSIYIVSHIV